MSKKRRKIVSEINDNAGKQEDIINQLKDKKESVPSEEKGTVRVTLDIPKSFHKKIKSYTKARGQSIKGYLLFLASQDMEE